ncbi:MAG: shikimate kinase [Bacteroidales bacterium]
MKIFLIGFMGSGKTTAGRKLSSRLNLQFIDLDNAIEKETGMTVQEIFKLKGEEYFREIESKTLRKLSGEDNFVMATGGGAPCFKDNIDFMNKKGITVYLKMNTAELTSRLKKGKAQRPLLAGKDNKEMQQFIEYKLKQRIPYYEKAQLITGGLNLNISTLAEKIREMEQ